MIVEFTRPNLNGPGDKVAISALHVTKVIAADENARIKLSSEISFVDVVESYEDVVAALGYALAPQSFDVPAMLQVIQALRASQ